jgi:hypothetical protein
VFPVGIALNVVLSEVDLPEDADAFLNGGAEVMFAVKVVIASKRIEVANFCRSDRR